MTCKRGDIGVFFDTMLVAYSPSQDTLMVGFDTSECSGGKESPRRWEER